MKEITKRNDKTCGGITKSKGDNKKEMKPYEGSNQRETLRSIFL